MKLWGGRFTKQTDRLAGQFNESLSFDCRMYHEDIRGSIAHVTMLAKQNILTQEDCDRIIDGLKSIEADIDAGRLDFAEKGSEYEDIHSFIEGHLTERIGDAGKRLHTGRSRNDQVALDMKMYTRKIMDNTIEAITELLSEILKLMEENKHTVMPGFTHLQKAQPTTLAHYLGAYFEMFIRDRDRIRDGRKRMNLCPLGAGAFAGTTYPLDRNMTAGLLDFDGPTENSMDSVSDRDYLLEFLSDLSIIAMHLSRLSEEIILWNTNEYRYVELDDAYATGSSIMPQKKNPDIAELIRGKTGRVFGALMALLTVMKGLPLAYNKDMQEDKEMTFDAMDTSLSCLKLMTGLLASVSFNKERMEESANGGYTNATDLADYLVEKGVPFRDAHGIAGKLVLYGSEHKKPLNELTIREFRLFAPQFDQDVFAAIDLRNCIKRRNTTGAPGDEAMNEELKRCRQRLDGQEFSV